MTKAIVFPMFCVLGLLAGTPRLFAQTGSISASPNPCTIYHTQSFCAATVSWTSRGTTAVQIWVSADGRETLFASHGSGRRSMEAGWIRLMKRYVFKLYDYSSGSRGSLLASTTVTAAMSILCPP